MTASQTIFLPLLAMLAMAAFTDLRERRIPNWLNAAILAAGLTRAAVHPGNGPGLGSALLGALLGFGLMLVPFAMGALRGGDVKLMTGLGAWLGPLGIFAVFVIEKIYGLVFVLAQAAATGRTRELLCNSARLAVNVRHVRTLGVEHVRSSGERFRSIDRPLPYAVPILAAVLTVIAWGITGG
jgi:prepilin peptidase CpaA